MKVLAITSVFIMFLTASCGGNNRYGDRDYIKSPCAGDPCSGGLKELNNAVI